MLLIFIKNTFNIKVFPISVESLKMVTLLVVSVFSSSVIKKFIFIMKYYKKNTRNIILSGGYALNCINNYKYTQYFKNVNFFIDPCPHDGGTSLGAAVWYDHYR